MAVISFSLFLHKVCFISFLEKANKNVNDNNKKNEHNQNKAFSLSQELLSQLLNAFLLLLLLLLLLLRVLTNQPYVLLFTTF